MAEICSLLADDELTEAAELVVRTFHAHVAPLFGPQGVEEFLRWATAEKYREIIQRGGFALGARIHGTLAGVAVVRDASHICMFFVDSSSQRQGIGRSLLSRIKEICARDQARPERITVNASPNAVPAYKRFGFTPTAPLQEMNGMRFMPMARALDPSQEEEPSAPLSS